MKEIVVIGGGVIGVTTAATLALRGVQVTLIERSPALGSGATARNGAQLSYSYGDALAAPSLFRELPKLLAGVDPAFRIHASFDPAFLEWIARFLANCTAARFSENTKAVVQLSLSSRRALAALRQRHPELDFRYAASGKLHIYDSVEKFTAARAAMQLKNELGCGQAALTRDELLSLEPALSMSGRKIVGAVWSPLDEAGDPQLFTRALARILARQYGVRVLTDTAAERLIAEDCRIVAVQTSRGAIEADAFVLAAGCAAVELARAVGVRLPIYPMKGYSITLPATVESPRISITDTRARIVFCRLDDEVRVAGMAELGRAKEWLDLRRIETLLQAARTCLPTAADWSADPQAWSGERPMTPDSRPIISTTAVSNLFVNCGHGMLGWTLACGSAELAAALILDQPRSREHQSMVEHFSLGRFSRRTHGPRGHGSRVADPENSSYN